MSEDIVAQLRARGEDATADVLEAMQASAGMPWGLLPVVAKHVGTLMKLNALLPNITQIYNQNLPHIQAILPPLQSIVANLQNNKATTDALFALVPDLQALIAEALVVIQKDYPPQPITKEPTP